MLKHLIENITVNGNPTGVTKSTHSHIYTQFRTFYPKVHKHNKFHVVSCSADLWPLCYHIKHFIIQTPSTQQRIRKPSNGFFMIIITDTIPSVYNRIKFTRYCTNVLQENKNNGVADRQPATN